MDSISRRDLDVLRAGTTPDFEARFAPPIVALVGQDGPVTHGSEAAARFMEAWYEAWGRFTMEMQEAIDLGNDRLLLLNHMHAEGASSGVAMGEQTEAQLWEFRGGLGARFQQWLSWAEALEAAGLSE